MGLRGDEEARGYASSVLIMSSLMIVLGAMMLLVGGGHSAEGAPVAQLSLVEADAADGEVVVAHRGGDALERDELKVVLRRGEEEAVLETDGSGVLNVGGKARFSSDGGLAEPGGRVQVDVVHGPSDPLLLDGAGSAD